MINAYIEGICVEFEEKNNTTLVYHFQIASKYLTSFKTYTR